MLNIILIALKLATSPVFVDSCEENKCVVITEDNQHYTVPQSEGMTEGQMYSYSTDTSDDGCGAW